MRQILDKMHVYRESYGMYSGEETHIDYYLATDSIEIFFVEIAPTQIKIEQVLEISDPTKMEWPSGLVYEYLRLENKYLDRKELIKAICESF